MGAGLEEHGDPRQGADLLIQAVIRLELAAPQVLMDLLQALGGGTAVIGIEAHVHIEQVPHEHGSLGSLHAPGAVGLLHAHLQILVLRDIGGDGIIHEERPPLILHHAAEGREGLGDGVDPEEGIRRQGSGMGHIPIPQVVFVQDLLPPAYGKGGSGQAFILHIGPEQPVQIFRR